MVIRSIGDSDLEHIATSNPRCRPFSKVVKWIARDVDSARMLRSSPTSGTLSSSADRDPSAAPPSTQRRADVPASLKGTDHSVGPASTTLADLLMPSLAAYPFSAVWTSLWGWSDQERENGVTYGGQSWLGRWAVDSFFSALWLRGGDTGGRRRRSSS